MNKERVKAVRDLIASLPEERFDMSAFGRSLKTQEPIPPSTLRHTCNTAGCIAGWAVVQRREAGLKRNRSLDHFQGPWFAEGKDWLELSEAEAGELFMPSGGYLDAITQAAAVATLDHLLETGEVKWPEKSGAPQ